jgi:hypothetical protein
MNDIFSYQEYDTDLPLLFNMWVHNFVFYHIVLYGSSTVSMVVSMVFCNMVSSGLKAVSVMREIVSVEGLEWEYIMQ